MDLKGATGLPLMVSHAFVQYELGGQLFTTETIEQDTHNPVLEYSFVHHVERVSAEVGDRKCWRCRCLCLSRCLAEKTRASMHLSLIHI